MIFADTSYFLALLNSNDQCKARTLWAALITDRHFEQTGFEMLLRTSRA
jgi:hypothetical protein